MTKKLTSLLLSVLMVSFFNLNAFAADTTDYSPEEGRSVLDYPDPNSPSLQKYRQLLNEQKVDPGKALALSALYFGLGQIYSGDVSRGAWILAGGTILTAGVLVVALPRIANRQESVKGVGTALGIGAILAGYLWNIRDAVNTAENVNAEINKKLLLSEKLIEELNKVSFSANEQQTYALNYRLVAF